MSEQTRRIYSSQHKVFDLYNTKLKQNEQISAKNKELIQQWQNTLFAKGTKQYRVGKLTGQMLTILKLLDYSDLHSLSIQEIIKLLAEINRCDKWKDRTKADFRRSLKQFYLWYEDYDDNSTDPERIKFYRHIRKNISIAYKIKVMDYSSIITEEDVNILVSKGCLNSRDKAFITMLHEGGFRIGELLNIKIKDIEFKDSYCIVQVDGKTGRRRVPLKIISVGHIHRWILDHPFKENPDAYLWTSLSTNCKGNYLNHRGASKICDTVFERSGLSKKHNPHWFRHSRATLNAKFMTESMLCNYFGWVPGSNQVRTYTHTDTQQVEDVLNKHYGLVTEEKNKPLFLACSTCQTNNSPGSKFCTRCGQPLSKAAADEKDDHMNLAFELMQELMKKPEYMEKFMKFKEGGA